MLHRYPVKELKAGGISKRFGYTAVVMQFYPRFLSKEKIDEYLHSLAPERSLFQEFKALERELKNHNQAFENVNYEERFEISAKGWEDLRRLATLSRDQEVYFLCQCGMTDKCHADLLLLAAKAAYGAKIPYLRQSYPLFEARLEKEPWKD